MSRRTSQRSATGSERGSDKTAEVLELVAGVGSRDDVSFPLVETDRFLDRGLGGAGIAFEAENLCKVHERVGMREKEVSCLGEGDGLIRQRSSDVDLLSSGERLCADGAPQDL